MAKKDSLGRVVVPSDIAEKCSLLNSKNKLAFGMNANQEVFVGDEFNMLHSSSNNFLGECYYDEKTQTLFIPANVDIALGSGSEYFFSENGGLLYIYRRPATLDLSKVTRYPKKAVGVVSKFLKKTLEEFENLLHMEFKI